jgi:hypothetical protein
LQELSTHCPVPEVLPSGGGSRIDGRIVKIEPKALAVAANSGEGDGVVTVELECGAVALIRRMVLAQAFVHDSHQAPRFSRFWFSTDGPTEVTFGLGKLALIEGSPRKDQIVGRRFLACPQMASKRAFEKALRANAETIGD